VLFTCLLALLTSCFGGYNSSWGQQKRAQRNFAAQQTPGQLRASDPQPRLARAQTARVLRVRAYATRAYTAQVLDWPRRFAETLAEGNRVLEPDLDVRFELVEALPWSSPGSEDDTRQLLKALRELDAGPDVDWVVGLVSAVPRFESSFHELGVGELVGKYIVVRAVNDVAEYQAFERGLTSLSVKERERLVRSRHQHKITTLWLHEVGHTLGALHDRRANSLMRPAHSHEQIAFPAESIRLMRHVIGNRAPDGGLHPNARAEYVNLLSTNPNPWLPADREAELARWQAVLPSAPVPERRALGVAAPPSDSSADDPLLSHGENQTLRSVRALKNQGQHLEALKSVRAVAQAHPDHYELQDLRCSLAMNTGGLAIDQVRVECDGLQQLMPAALRSKKK